MRVLFTALLALLAMTVTTPLRAAEWMEVRTAHFTLYGKQSQKDLVQLAGRLERMNRLLGMLLPHARATLNSEAERPLLIYVLSASDVKSLSGSALQAGFYSFDKRNGYAVVTRGEGAGPFSLDQEVILFHEFAHHFMLANSNAAYPAWYIEGFAEFFSTVKFQDDDKVQFGNPPMVRVPQLVMAGIYPIDKLLHQSARGLNRADGDRYYGAAWLLTHYLVTNKARGKEFEAYVTDLASPRGARDVASYFNGGEAALTRELRAYVKTRLPAYRIPVPIEGLAQPQARQLAPDEAAVLLLDLHLKRRLEDEGRKELAERIRAVARQYPQSGLAQTLFAEALEQIDDWTGAMAAADAAIRLAPASSRALADRADILLARSETDKGEPPFGDIVKAIVAANRADLQDPYPLLLYYRVKRMQGTGPAPDVAFEGLEKAFLQLPQSPTYRWAYADALAARKDYANAVTVITPLANDPHGEGGTGQADAMRQRYIALRDGKPVPEAGAEGD